MGATWEVLTTTKWSWLGVAYLPYGLLDFTVLVCMHACISLPSLSLSRDSPRSEQTASENTGVRAGIVDNVNSIHFRWGLWLRGLACLMMLIGDSLPAKGNEKGWRERKGSRLRIYRPERERWSCAARGGMDCRHRIIVLMIGLEPLAFYAA